MLPVALTDDWNLVTRPVVWILGAFVQQWFSFAGSNSRSGVSQLNLQPIASWFLPDG